MFEPIETRLVSMTDDEVTCEFETWSGYRGDHFIAPRTVQRVYPLSVVTIDGNTVWVPLVPCLESMGFEVLEAGHGQP